MSFVTKAFDAWAKHRKYRETKNELAALTDRELQDLGISRGQIHEVAREAAYA